jgi:hypothetical protein
MTRISNRRARTQRRTFSTSRCHFLLYSPSPPPRPRQCPRRPKHDLRPPHDLLPRVAIPHQSHMPLTIFGRNLDAFDLAHKARLASLRRFGNPPMRAEHYDLSQPLPYKIRMLLVQLGEPTTERLLGRIGRNEQGRGPAGDSSATNAGDTFGSLASRADRRVALPHRGLERCFDWLPPLATALFRTEM